MLVLTRRKADEVVFPALGISVKVIRVRRGHVKLGICAPRAVKVLRGELCGFDEPIETLRQLGGQIFSHDLRGRLNAALLNLEQLAAARSKGIAVDENAIIDRLLDLLSGLDAKLCDQAIPLPLHEPELAGNTHLLVVDDNANERELLKSVLTIQGFHVDLAGDGQEAIQLLNLGRLPHAVLLDLHMPGLGGEHTLRCIRSDVRLRNLRVFGISGFQPSENLLPDDLPGFDAWFDKPLDVQRLIELVHETSAALVE